MTRHTRSASRSVPNRLKCPAQMVLHEWITSMIPGQSQAISHLRSEVLSFCANPMVRAALLRGPVGSGKSTIARIMAYGRRIAPLDETKAHSFIRDIRYDVPGAISLRSMSWYVEMAVTGLTESLADTQLFGVAPGVATGVEARRGVFEQAGRGRAGPGDVGAELTGGIVFLDEIADISPSLQAKLLPILSGGRTYRVGGEGNPKYEVEFDGVVIAATWHKLHPDQFRPDLLSRLSSTTIRIPGLTERKEDLPDVIDSLEAILTRQQQSRLRKVASLSDVDRVFWRRAAETTRVLSPESRAKLLEVNWSEHANLRGLIQVMERVLFEGVDVDHVLSARPPVSSTTGGAASDFNEVNSLLEGLLQEPGAPGGLARLVRSAERRRRTALREALAASPGARKKLARYLSLDGATLRRQIQQLDRTRTRGHE